METTAPALIQWELTVQEVFTRGGITSTANDGTNRLFISSDRRIKTDIEEVMIIKIN